MSNEKEMRAKVRVASVTDYGHSEVAKMEGVYDDGTEENRRFNEASPSIDFEIMIDNPQARGILKPGDQWYIDFVKAEPEE